MVNAAKPVPPSARVQRTVRSRAMTAPTEPISAR